MPDYISSEIYKKAIEHIVRFGDTDIFPHLIESRFVAEKIEDVANLLAGIDINNFDPAQSIEALAPKSRYGFRIANQLTLLNCIVFTAAVINIGDDLESFKQVQAGAGPFSYIFESGDDGSIFASGHTYRDWIEEQKSICEEKQFESVVFTDIADFYQRIYFHRMQNVLRSATPKTATVNLIEKMIRRIRSRQSYGIPVGGTASRIIAEAILADFDHTLQGEEYEFTRFVDDIRIYIKDEQSAYHALSLAAETLLAEGLTLNAQKTRVVSKEEYVSHLDEAGNDTFDEAQRNALNSIVSAMYFNEVGIDEDQLKILQAANLSGMLNSELGKDLWDFGRIRSIFRAMRIVGDATCVDELVSNLSILLPFIRDIVLLLDALKREQKLGDFDITDKVLEELSRGAGLAVPVIRAWLLEMFIRDVTPISSAKVNTIDRQSELDGRQIILIHGVNGNIVYFRKNKTRFDSFSKYEQYALLLGASCLPKDEYETWISAVKPMMNKPLDSEFCDWLKTKHGDLRKIVEANGSLYEHP